MSAPISPMRAMLLQKKEVLEANIREAQRELEKVLFALSTHEGTLFETPDKVPPLVLTDNGTIRNLPGRIVELLEHRKRVLSITDMARDFFNMSMPMTPDQLRRRLSVATSAMYKNIHPAPVVPSGIRNNNREHYWALPDWMVNDQLMDQYKPKMDTHLDLDLG